MPDDAFQLGALAAAYASGVASRVATGATARALAGVSLGDTLATTFPGSQHTAASSLAATFGALAELRSTLAGPLADDAAEVKKALEVARAKIYVALKTLPAAQRAAIGAPLLTSMQARPGAWSLCIGPGADGGNIGCTTTSPEGIEAAAISLDANVQKWIAQYRTPLHRTPPAAPAPPQRNRLRSVAIVGGGIAAFLIVIGGIAALSRTDRT